MNYIRRNQPIITVLLLCLAIRIIYREYSPDAVVTPDSFGYYDIGRKMLSESFWPNFVNDHRTPLYPLFLNVLMAASGNIGAAVGSAQFMKGATFITIVQSVIALTGLYLLYKTALILKIEKRYASLFTLFISLNHLLFAWEGVLLTESLVIFWIILTTYILLIALKKIGSSVMVILLLLFIAGFLLKPAYLAFPLVTLPIIAFTHQKKGILMPIVVSLLLFLAVPFAYIKGNEALHNYSGVNHITDINLMGRILQYNLPVEAGRDVTFFYGAVRDYRAIGGDPMPYRFLEYYDPQIYDKPERLNDLQRFTRAVVLDNLPRFITLGVAEIPKRMLEPNDLIAENPEAPFLLTLFNGLRSFYTAAQYLTLLVLPLFFLVLFRFFRKPSFPTAATMIIGVIALYQIIVSVFFGYSEFGRLISVVQPQLYLFLLLQLPPNNRDITARINRFGRNL